MGASLSTKIIKEIVEYLECGDVCGVHKKTGELLNYPKNHKEFYMDDEFNPWQEIVDEMENNSNDYYIFYPMDTPSSYRIMEDFALAVNDEILQGKLHFALSKPKPFSRFKNCIDYSDSRQDWFDFRRQQYVAWVKEQLRGMD